MVDLISAQHQPNHNKTTNQLKRKRHGLTTKKTTNKKLIVSEERPRNDEERKALQMNKTKPTMLVFVNFPAGRKTKSTRKVEANNSPIPKQARLQKSACKVSMAALQAVEFGIVIKNIFILFLVTSVCERTSDGRTHTTSEKKVIVSLFEEL